MEFAGEQFSPPASGDIWGANLIRVYRGMEFVQ